jgi:hypothetical protein
MKRGTVANLMALVAASMGNIGDNVVISAGRDIEYRACSGTPRLPRMSPADFSRARSKAGHPKRHKNRATCAKKAKLKRRRAA